MFDYRRVLWIALIIICTYSPAPCFHEPPWFEVRSSEPQTWRWSAGIRRAPEVPSTLLSRDQNDGPAKTIKIAYEKNVKDFLGGPSEIFRVRLKEFVSNFLRCSPWPIPEPLSPLAGDSNGSGSTFKQHYCWSVPPSCSSVEPCSKSLSRSILMVGWYGILHWIIIIPNILANIIP